MKKYGFIGAGKMASAIIKALIKGKGISVENIACTCADDPTGEILSKQTGIKLFQNLDELLNFGDVVLVACKPQQLVEVENTIKQTGSDYNLDILLSILAGSPISRLKQAFPFAKKVVRIMPNMPAQISEGISGYASSQELSQDDLDIVEGILNAMGSHLKVEESQLDAITAISGSGPAYLFEFAASMINSAKKMGFDDEDAKLLVYKTLSGSAKLLEKSELSADELRKSVSSPGGTTLAALSVFDKNNFRNIIDEALIAAKDRSIELSKM